MRKLIVKYFALDYFYNIFGWKLNGPRAGSIILPLFILTGLSLIFFTPDYPNPSFITWVLYLLDIIALFFGFVYFHFKPVKWEELDENQKFQYGFSGKELTPEQYKEWKLIYNKYNKI